MSIYYNCKCCGINKVVYKYGEQRCSGCFRKINNERKKTMRVKVYNQEENEKTVRLGLRKVGGGVEVVIHDKHGCIKGKIFKFQDDGKICTYYACEEVQGIFQTDNNNRFSVSNF